MALDDQAWGRKILVPMTTFGITNGLGNHVEVLMFVLISPVISTTMEVPKVATNS